MLEMHLDFGFPSIIATAGNRLRYFAYGWIKYEDTYVPYGDRDDGEDSAVKGL